MKEMSETMKRSTASVAAWAIAFVLASAEAGLADAPAGSIPWNMAELSKAPKTHPAEGFEGGKGVRGLFFEGPALAGKPTRVFAWLGIPEVKSGRKVPGMVLVHGGGGTAFARWVRLWVARGYAAIAMDTSGRVPGTKGTKYPKTASHDHAGPGGWGGFGDVDKPAKDQWTYHAVSAVILAHSLLRSRGEVDTGRIGITGISWGGWLTSIVMSVDQRFRFAVPVYGCGFLQRDSFLVGNFKRLGPEKARRWQQFWEPSNYLPAARHLILWLNGTNDFAYPLSCLQKSYRATPSRERLCIRIRMPHGHEPGWAPKEIAAFADSIVRKGVPLPEITAQGCTGGRAWVAFRSRTKIKHAELCYTKETGHWQKRTWESLPAEIDAAAGKASAALPEGAGVYFINVTDERGMVASGEHAEP